MTNVADLEARLKELHVRTAETPLFNPVFQLGLELSRKLESGELTLDDIEGLVAEMECEGLRARAMRLDRLVGPLDEGQNHQKIEAVAQGLPDQLPVHWRFFRVRTDRLSRQRRDELFPDSPRFHQPDRPCANPCAQDHIIHRQRIRGARLTLTPRRPGEAPLLDVGTSNNVSDRSRIARHKRVEYARNGRTSRFCRACQRNHHRKHRSAR